MVTPQSSNSSDHVDHLLYNTDIDVFLNRTMAVKILQMSNLSQSHWLIEALLQLSKLAWSSSNPETIWSLDKEVKGKTITE